MAPANDLSFPTTELFEHQEAAMTDKSSPEPTPQDAVGNVETEDGAVAAEAKAAFAAALERKKQAGQARSAHLDGHGGVGGSTASHKATRTFRRKSG